MAYFTGQGRVYIGRRDASGNPLDMRWVGNVPDLKLSLATETEDHQESYSGQRLTDLTLIKSKTGTLSATLEDLSIENLELAMYGSTTTVTAGTVTDEALASGVVAGSVRLLTHQFISNVVVTDSAGVPNTLTEGTHYKVLAEQGAIEFLDVTTGGPYTEPFLADYDYGAAKSMAMFKAPQPEIWLRFDGINTSASNERVVIDLYKVALDPAQDFSFIGDTVQQFPISGKVLADLTKPDTGDLGQFGRIIMQSP